MDTLNPGVESFAQNHPNARQDTALGILYAEDFGTGRTKPWPPPTTRPPSSTPPPPAALTQADIDRACIRAVQAAESAWSSGAEDRRAEALSALASNLTQARADAARHAEAVADSIARTVLTILAGLLPDLSRNHGDAEVRALLKHLVPILAPGLRLVIRVHPDLVDILAQDVATLDDTLLPHIELRPANLQPGDVRLAWEDGSLTRDAAAMVAAVHDSLKDCGLTVPPSIFEPPGSIDHAQ